ncbi:MAG: hypothetical protein A2Z66_00220 [Chloroflexi bacterium RBG_13_66_10]|nr:MAG: hypothetical protein A2Z66_00220 [Chloroflexi bacterium RBG_13_66_10]
MKTLVRLEELALFLFSVYLFSTLSFPWWLFPVLLLAPDLSMIGYAGGAALGAEIYNAVHHRGVALILYVAGVWLALPAVSLAGVILLAHSSLDRVLGYGLKYPGGFANTHLGRIGRQPG